MEHAFGSGEPFSVGVEEELLLVDPGTLALAPVAAEVLAASEVEEGMAGPEAYAAEVEVRSPPARTAAAAVDALVAARGALRRGGATLMGVGLHPTAAFGDAPLVAQERYRRVDDSMRGLIRRTPECALHVHVGLPDAETAVAVFNRVRAHLPLLGALAGASPWWFGRDSGLASARWAVVRSYPGRGVPRPLRDWADYEAWVGAQTAAGGVRDYTYLWPDVRLHPRLGTIELRELDVQSRPRDAVAIAGLVQALARQAAEADDEPPPTEAIAWSAFRAARDGLEATIYHEGRLAPVPAVARAVLARAASAAVGVGAEDALAEVERLLVDGAGADRQRAAAHAGGERALLELLVAETAEDG